jgi:hypothetical protein
VIRLTGTIEHADGRLEQFTAGTSALMAYERYAIRNGLPIGADAPLMTMAHVVAWYATAPEGVGFETWAKGVTGVELDSEGIPPTPPGALAA